jgi:glyoxylase-like metal-dependent hydrolase (beta-lactamase superfamily II)
MFQWHILTVGHLSRNKFWGEDEKLSYRMPLATCTLLRGENENIIIDPSLPTEQMAEALLNNSGLKPEDITKVYCTHYHYDHQVCLNTFANAQWFMPEADLKYLRDHLSEIQGIWSKLDTRQVAALQPAVNEIAPGLKLVPLQGHTPGLSGLLFMAPEGRILASGDAVMTREFYAHGEPYFFCWNMELAIASIRSIKGIADVIIPGHGQPFQTKAYE